MKQIGFWVLWEVFQLLCAMLNEAADVTRKPDAEREQPKKNPA